MKYSCMALLLGMVTLALAAAPPEIFPQPHEVQWQQAAPVTLTRDGRSRLTLHFAGTPDALQQRALDKFAAAVRKTGHVTTGDVFTPDGDVALHCGVAPEVVVTGLPDQTSAYAIAITPETITVSGHDASGLRYGLLVLKQLLEDAPEGVALPPGIIRDSPEIPYSSCPMWIGTPEEVLEFISDEGRINWCFSEFITVKDYANQITGEVDWRQYRDLVERLHRNGIKISATAGWLTSYIRSTEGRLFCPVKDMPRLLELYQKAIDAGVDGLSMHFDDISVEEAMHWRTCPECQAAGFTSLGQAQAYCLQQIYDFGSVRGIENFWACPTQYTRYRNFPLTYSKPDPDMAEEKYFAAFFNFPAADHYKFYYCDFGRGEFESVARMGFRNFMWWNNGVWSGSFILIFKAGVTFPSFLQGWGFWELKDGVESFDYERFQNLVHLPEFTEYNYTGSSGPLALALGSTFSWNPKAYVADEEAVRRHFINLLFGPDGFGLVKEWESIAKPLWLKHLRMEPFDAADLAGLKRLPEIHAALAADRTYPEEFYGDLLTSMPPAIEALEQYARMFQELAPAADADGACRAYRRNGELLTVVPASQPLPAGAEPLQPAQHEQPPRLLRLAGRPAWVEAKSWFAIPVPGAEMDNRSFSLVLAFTPTVMPGENCTMLGGTRESYRAAYPGLPGWGLGMSTFAGELEFTVEDTDKNVSSIAKKNLLEANRFVTVVAVRDAAAKQLRLYVDGKLVEETAEKGSGHLGGRNSIQSGYDNWGGAYFIGGMHYFSLLDRALNASEVAALDRTLRQ